MVAESKHITDAEKSLNTQMERKLAALTAINSALTVENEDLRAQLEAQLGGQDGESAAADLKELQEEFAKRLGTADRNVAELREERDKLRIEVSSLKTSNTQSEQRATDLDQTVKTLRAELDKLHDASRQRESSTHRLRHESQAASAELSSCKQRIQTLEASLQEAQERLFVTSADAGSREQELEQDLSDVKERCREEVKQANIRTQEAQESLERAQEEQEVLAHAAAQHDELLEQLTSLRISLSQAQADIAGKEDELQESRACLDRLVRKQDESRSTDTVSTELLAQIDRLSHSLAQAQDDGAQALSELQGKYVAARRALEESEERAVDLEEKVQGMKVECVAWTEQMTATDTRIHELEEQLKAEQEKAANAGRLADKLKQAAEEAAAKSSCEHAELQAEVHNTTQLLTRTEALLAQAQTDRDTLKSRLSEFLEPQPPLATDGNLVESALASSSVLPIGPAAGVFTQAIVSPLAPEGGIHRVPSTSGAFGLEPQSFRHSRNGSVVDGEWKGSLLLEGQVEGLQAHFKTVEAERDALHTQLLQTYNTRNALAEKEAEVTAAASERARLQAHLDIATEMIGEQNSRINELEEDIADMRAIFHDQLDEAMTQLQAVKEQSTPTAATPTADTEQGAAFDG